MFLCSQTRRYARCVVAWLSIGTAAHVFAQTSSLPGSESSHASVKQSETVRRDEQPNDQQFDALYRRMSQSLADLPKEDRDVIDVHVRDALRSAVVMRRRWPLFEMVWFQLGDLKWLMLTNEPFRLVIEPQWSGGMTTVIDLPAINARPWYPPKPNYSNKSFCAGMPPIDGGPARFSVSLQRRAFPDTFAVVYKTEIVCPIDAVSNVAEVIKAVESESIRDHLKHLKVRVVDFGSSVALELSGPPLPQDAPIVSVCAELELDGVPIGKALFNLLPPECADPNDEIVWQRGTSDPLSSFLPLDLYVDYNAFKERWAKSQNTDCVFRGDPSLAARLAKGSRAWIGATRHANVELQPYRVAHQGKK